MTGLLRDTMTERADALESPHVDLETIMATGQRRVTRRRTTLAASGAAVTVAVLATIPLAGRPQAGPHRVGDVAGAFAAHEVAYAVDHTIHIGEDSFDVGHRVRALVQTDRGVVFTDLEGEVYAADGTDVERVGHTGPTQWDQQLVADGSRVAWLDTSHGRFVALDQESGRTDTLSARPVVDAEFLGQPLTIDDVVVYAQDDRGVFAWDLGTGIVTLATGEKPYDFCFDVKGEVATNCRDGRGPQGRVTVSELRVGDHALPMIVINSGDKVVLSPDGSMAAVQIDSSRVVVVDTRSAESRQLDVPDGYGLIAGYHWRDDSSFLAMGIRAADQDRLRVGAIDLGQVPISIIECSVATATCATLVESVGTIEHVALPLGGATAS